MARKITPQNTADTPMTRWLKTVRAMHGLKQEELAQYINKSRSAVNSYENSQSPVPDDVIEAIAAKLPNAPPPPARVGAEMPKRSKGFDLVEPRTPYSDGRRVSVTGLPLAPIKVVGNVSAGVGTYNVDPAESEIYVPYSLAQIGGLGWIIDGDSMMPELEPGMVAIFREWRQPRQHLTFLLQGPEGDTRVKNLVWRPGGWMMESVNPDYPAEPLGEYQLLGYLIGWYRVRGRRETMDSDPDGLVLSPR